MFLTIILMFSAVSARLIFIAVNSEDYISALDSSYNLYLGINRGDILDCGGRPLVNEQTVRYAVVLPTERDAEIMHGYLDESAEKTLQNGFPAAVRVDDDFNQYGISVFSVKKRYGSNLAAHLIGYLNSENEGAAGIEKSFEDILNGGEICVRFKQNAKGDVLSGIAPQLAQSKQTGSVRLTIDKRLQSIAETAAEKYIKTGAVVVLDNENGKIRAMCSLPCFDADNLSKSLDDENLPFINRALSAYSCGSVFKLCIAAAALDGDNVISHYCTGNETVGGINFGCLSSHGNMTLEQAVAYSCNSYFIALGQVCGADKCYRMAKLMGFGTKCELCKGIISAAGSLNTIDDLRQNPAALANFSFGQGEVLTTPLQIASLVQCIANGGRRYIPSLVEAVTDKNGDWQEYSEKSPVIVMSESKANELKKCMRAATTYGTGKSASVKGCVTGGKTATAQTGKYDENGKEYLQAWFAGLVEKGDKSYTVAVMVENGITGGVSAAPVFSEIAERL